MGENDKATPFQRTDLEVFKFNVQRHVSETELANVEVEGYADYVGESMVIMLKASIAGQELEEFKYPRDWKESVKERFFPSWLLEKYPVRYTTLNVRALYPKLRIKPEGDVVPIFHVERLPTPMERLEGKVRKK